MQYGLACGVYFDAVHKACLRLFVWLCDAELLQLPEHTTGLIESPNQYFDLSRTMRKTGEAPRAQQRATTAPTQYTAPRPDAEARAPAPAAGLTV